MAKTVQQAAADLRSAADQIRAVQFPTKHHKPIVLAMEARADALHLTPNPAPLPEVPQEIESTISVRVE